MIIFFIVLVVAIATDICSLKKLASKNDIIVYIAFIIVVVIFALIYYSNKFDMSIAKSILNVIEVNEYGK